LSMMTYFASVPFMWWPPTASRQRTYL
jgi:hypothetical protein